MVETPRQDSLTGRRGGDNTHKIEPFGKRVSRYTTIRREGTTPIGNTGDLPASCTTNEYTINIHPDSILAHTCKSGGVEYVCSSPDPIGMYDGVSKGDGTGSAKPGIIEYGGSPNMREEAHVVGSGASQPTTPYAGTNLYHAIRIYPITTRGAPPKGYHSGGDMEATSALSLMAVQRHIIEGYTRNMVHY